jgi:acid phosphatase (class A)
VKIGRWSLGWIVWGALSIGAPAATDVDNPHWLSDADISAIITSEPSPPVPGSDAEKDDVQKELAAQKGRTPESVGEARKDQSYSVMLFFGIVGPSLTPAADPAAFRFFNQLDNQVAQVVGVSKGRWKRPRPYQAHPDILRPLFTAGGSSYPSGHAMNAFAFAVVLGQMWPNHAEAFLAGAQEIADSRVVAGVHYTTDIHEGEIVGKEVAKELFGKPAFQQQLKAVEAEVATPK